MMWWYVLQYAAFFVVAGSNIIWEWTPNPTVVGIFGGLIAYCLTWLIFHRGNWRKAFFANTPRRSSPWQGRFPVNPEEGGRLPRE